MQTAPVHHRFSVGVVSDEASPDGEGLLRFIARCAPDHVELNFVHGVSICDLGRVARARLRDRLRDAGVSVSAIGSRAFRGELHDDARFLSDLEHLGRATDAAHYFDARVIRVFSFARARRRAGPVPLHLAHCIRDRLRQAATIVAGRCGATLACENTGSGNLATTEEVRAFLAADAPPALGLVWDPANAVGAGDPLPATAAYAQLRPWVEQIHVKNVIVRGTERTWTAVASGSVAYPDLLRLVAQHGPCHLTIDTHFRLAGDDGAESTAQCLDELRAMLRALAAAPSASAGP
jgi:sugar phosphate isomerase/epimerase